MLNKFPRQFQILPCNNISKEFILNIDSTTEAQKITKIDIENKYIKSNNKISI